MAFSITATTISADSSSYMVSNGFAGGTIKFINLNAGSVFSSGIVVIGIVNNQSNITPSGFTVGSSSNSAGTTSLTLAQASSVAQGALYYATVPANTVDHCQFTNGNSFADVGVCAWSITGGSTSGLATASSSSYGVNGSSQSTTLTNPSGGGQVNLSFDTGSNSSGATWTWTNATADPTLAFTGRAVNLGQAHNVGSGSQTVTSVMSNGLTFNQAMVSAAFSVAAVTLTPLPQTPNEFPLGYWKTEIVGY